MKLKLGEMRQSLPGLTLVLFATVAGIACGARAEDFRNTRTKVGVARDFGASPTLAPAFDGGGDEGLPSIAAPVADPSVCGGAFRIGDVVSLDVSRAIAGGKLHPGAVGRIVSSDGSSVLVEFSGFTDGHGGNGWSTMPSVADVGTSRWWVACTQLERWNGLPTPLAGGLVIGDYLSGPSDASGGVGYTAALAEMGIASTPMSGLTGLEAYDVVFILHQNNASILGLGASAAMLSDWVHGGGILVVHDRNVNQSRLWVPGLAQTTWANAYPSTCDLGADAASTVQGSFGVLTDASLDGGNWSLHGFITSPLPPASLRALKFNGALTAAIAYPFGSGWVYYSTLPLDHYLAGNGIASMVSNGRVYAKNVAERMIARACQVGDCNGNGICDSAELAGNDCNANGTLDVCDIASGVPDCNSNGIPDSCDIASGFDPDPEGDGVPNSCEPRSGIRLVGPVESGAGCLAVADELAFDVFIDNPPVTVVAGQFTLAYDASVLEFVEVLGGQEPFTYVPLFSNDAAAGRLLFVASVQEGGTGTLSDSRVARVRFRAIDDDCDGSTQIAFDESVAPILIADGGGNSAGLPLTNPSPVRIVTGAPVLTNVPGDLVISADAGAGCIAIRTLVPPLAGSSCGAVALEWARSDGLALGAPWPCGVTTVTWTATDICGRVTQASTTVTVQPYHELLVTVAFAGAGYSGPMQRCIDLTVGGVVLEQVFTFTDGVAQAELQLPVGTYECATADDDLHSLLSRTSVLIQGTRYAVVFAGDAALRNGDLTDDNSIDVTDWGIAVVAMGTSASVNTDCSTPGYHIDFDGNGTVDTADGNFILDGFLLLGESVCSGGGGLGGGRSSITVAALAELVGSAALLADLNGDAVVDRADIDLWVAQHGQD